MTRHARAATALAVLALLPGGVVLSGCALLGIDGPSVRAAAEKRSEKSDWLLERSLAEQFGGASSKSFSEPSESSWSCPESDDVPDPCPLAAPDVPGPSDVAEPVEPAGAPESAPVPRPADVLGPGTEVIHVDPTADLTPLLALPGEDGAVVAAGTFLSGWVRVQTAGDPTVVERVALPECAACDDIARRASLAVEGYDLTVSWEFWVLEAEVGDDAGDLTLVVSARAFYLTDLEPNITYLHVEYDGDTVYDLRVQRVGGQWRVAEIASRPWAAAREGAPV